MLPITALAPPFAYALPPQKTASYAVTLKLNGFLPVFGGSDGTAQADIVLGLQGQTPDADGSARLAYELKDLQVYFNEAKFTTITVENAKPFFPRTTISFNPNGKVLKTDSPDIHLPIRLPGLDSKRFPEITFLGIELPSDGVTEGKTWTYKKPFADSEVDVEAKAVSVQDGKVEVEYKVKQSFDTQEDAGKGIPANPKDAVANVHTEMSGTGKATLDSTVGLLKTSHLEADAVSTVTDIATKAVSTRKLHTTVDVKLGDTNTPVSMVEDSHPPTKADQLKAMLRIYWQVMLTKATPYIEAFKVNLIEQISRLQEQIAHGF